MQIIKKLIRTVYFLLDVAVKIGKRRSGHFPPPPYPSTIKYNLELKSKPWQFNTFSLDIMNRTTLLSPTMTQPVEKKAQMKASDSQIWCLLSVLLWLQASSRCQCFRAQSFLNRWLLSTVQLLKGKATVLGKEMLSIYFFSRYITYKINNELLIVKPLRMKKMQRNHPLSKRDGTVIFKSLSALS